MKFSALALDYDGTIAANGGGVDPAVRAAIAEARQRGIIVALVTGRRLSDLRRVAGDLSCFDVVVAENGAVLEFPSSGRHVLLSHPPSETVLAEFVRRGLDVMIGESVIEADAALAAPILDVIRRLEQPLILAFNRSRLMVLPQAVAKSTGLRQALRALRVSIHNTVGVGDAENDHDLLDSCEVGVAVEWGSPALRAVADEIIRGTGPSAVADYVNRVSRQPRLSAGQMGRRRLALGHQHDGLPVSLAVRGRTIIVAGEPGTGKSFLAGLLCEQLILQDYCVCIIDPEGDYRSLEALPSVIVLGGDDPPPSPREIEQALRYSDISVIVDLSKMLHHEKVEYLNSLLPTLNHLRRRTGLPHKILVDEAHYFLGPGSAHLLDPELAGYILVTYRVSALDEAVRATNDAVVMVTRETSAQECEALLAMCAACRKATFAPEIFRELQTSEAALLPGPEEAHGQVRRFRMAPRLTGHVRHRTKYLDMPIRPSQAFVFTQHGQPGPRAHTLRAFVGLLTALPAEELQGHLQRHDFSQWLDHVFRDRSLAAHILHLEQRVDALDVRYTTDAIAQAIRARYEVADGAESESRT